MIITAAAAPSAFWYLTRGTGAITLILLTVSVALGVANVRRARTASVPRFVFDAVHRNASLLAVAFLLVHIATSLLDGFAPIRLLDVVVPFGSAYRPLWLGFGALAFDLLIAVALTSVARRRLGYRTWRATHWAAYASWPFALIHGLGSGSDTRTSWMLALTGACVIVVIVAVVARVSAGWPEHPGARATAVVASALAPIGLIVWLPSGPLAAGWAKRAGTPHSLLVAASTGRSAPATKGARRSGGSTTHVASFTAHVSGTVRQGRTDDGLEFVHISLRIASQPLSSLRIRIDGHPAAGGGVAMTSSALALGPSSNPDLYRGRVSSLAGTNIEGSLSDSGGSAITLVARLQIDPASGVAAGTATASPAGGS